MNIRLKKLNELFRREISQMFLKEVDFGDVLVTIIEVVISKDLKYAKVKITVLPDDKQETVAQILEKNVYQLQQKINKKLLMRPVPKIVFQIDQSQSKAQKIEKLLSQIKTEHKP